MIGAYRLLTDGPAAGQYGERSGRSGGDMATEAVTVHLPALIYRTARHVAEATGQPLDAVLQASIAHALPPLDDVPADEAAELAALALLDDGALWRTARAAIEAGAQAEVQALLDRQSAGELSTADAACLNDLLQRCGRLTVRKAHAYLLLARRGYRVPMQDTVG